MAACRFVLGSFNENKVRDDHGYSLLEPELTFFIGEINVFEAFCGRPTFNNVVIMHAREEWLKQTGTKSLIVRCGYSQ